MKVLFINHEGGGFANHQEVPEGTTIAGTTAATPPPDRNSLYQVEAARIASVTLKGDNWDRYDADAETVDIPSSENTIQLTVSYI